MRSIPRRLRRTRSRAWERYVRWVHVFTLPSDEKRISEGKKIHVPSGRCKVTEQSSSPKRRGGVNKQRTNANRKIHVDQDPAEKIHTPEGHHEMSVQRPCSVRASVQRPCVRAASVRPCTVRAYFIQSVRRPCKRPCAVCADYTL